MAVYIERKKNKQIRGSSLKSTRTNGIIGMRYLCKIEIIQDKIFRRKRLSTGANFVHVYIQIWDKGLLKFNKFLM